MTTDQLNSAVRSAHDAGVEVSDGVAATIASYWHSGMSSAFYAFASSGHYDRDALLRELSDTINMAYDGSGASDRLQLDMLGTYFLNRKA